MLSKGLIEEFYRYVSSENADTSNEKDKSRLKLMVCVYVHINGL